MIVVLWNNENGNMKRKMANEEREEGKRKRDS